MPACLVSESGERVAGRAAAGGGSRSAGNAMCVRATLLPVKKAESVMPMAVATTTGVVAVG